MPEIGSWAPEEFPPKELEIWMEWFNSRDTAKDPVGTAQTDLESQVTGQQAAVKSEYFPSPSGVQEDTTGGNLK